jgi:hypothetical protein
MEPAAHDRALAWTSHVVHVIAYALAGAVGAANGETLRYGGPSLRDATRVAASSPELWADILLTNAAEVLTPTQIARLAQAAKSETPVHIVTQEELASGAARTKKVGNVTWKFAAKNVRDAVWAASPEYMWDASSWQGHMAFAYYRPSAIGRKDAADMSRMSIMGIPTVGDISVPADQRRRGVISAWNTR